MQSFILVVSGWAVLLAFPSYLRELTALRANRAPDRSRD
jgi:hypothetical protein